MITNFTGYIKESKDYDVQADYYFAQVDSTLGWKPITDDLYESIEMEGWVDELTADLSDEEYENVREKIKPGSVTKNSIYFINGRKDT